MIERKKFLELCQRNAVYPDSVEVAFHDLPNVFYNPISLNIWFDKKGVARNTAVIKQVGTQSVIYADLFKLDCYD